MTNYRTQYVEPTDIAKSFVPCYDTWQEASKVCIENRVLGISDYEKRHKLIDPRLPNNPETFYKNRGQDWPGWFVFLGIEIENVDKVSKPAKKTSVITKIGVKDEDYYKTWQEASLVCIANNVTGSDDYLARYKLIDPRLPRDQIYYYRSRGQMWPGWSVFLNKYYKTWQEAGKIAIANNILTHSEYGRCYNIIDPKLPSNPAVYYTSKGQKWPGWKKFLGQK